MICWKFLFECDPFEVFRLWVYRIHAYCPLRWPPPDVSTEWVDPLGWRGVCTFQREVYLSRGCTFGGGGLTSRRLFLLGMYLPRVYLLRGSDIPSPILADRMTHTCENITFHTVYEDHAILTDLKIVLLFLVMPWTEGSGLKNSQRKPLQNYFRISQNGVLFMYCVPVNSLAGGNN